MRRHLQGFWVCALLCLALAHCSKPKTEEEELAEDTSVAPSPKSDHRGIQKKPSDTVPTGGTVPSEDDAGTLSSENPGPVNTTGTNNTGSTPATADESEDSPDSELVDEELESDAEDSTITVSDPTPEPLSPMVPAFTSLTLGSAVPLVYSALLPTTANGAPNQPVIVSNTALGSSGIHVSSISGSPLSCSGCQAPGASSAQPTLGAGADATDATSGSDVLPLTVTYSGTNLSSPACNVLGDYAAFDCLLTGFSLLRSQLVRGVLGIEAFDVDQPSVQQQSNVLTSSLLRVKRVSNWNTGEDVKAVRAVGSGSNQRLVFEGRTAGGNQPQLFTYSPQTQQVERLTWSSPFNANTQNPSVNSLDHKVYGRVRLTNSLSKGYVYDPVAGTIDVFTNTAGSSRSDNLFTLSQFGNRIFFAADNPNQQRKLYFYDSNAAQIWQLFDRNGANTQDVPSNTLTFPVAGGRMYFVAEAGAGLQKLFFYDGESAVRQVTDLVSGGSDAPMHLTPLGTRLCFVGHSIRKLYCFDGTALTQVSNTAGQGMSDEITQVVADGSQALYFVAEVSAGVKKLFRYDGTSVKSLGDTSGTPTVSDHPSNLFLHQGKVYFSGIDPGGKTRLFEYNPTTNTLIRVTRTSHANADDAPGVMVSYHGSLYFVALNAAGHQKLFRYDGTSVVQVSNTHPGGSDDLRNLTVLGNTLYFSARSSSVTANLNLWALCDPGAGCSL